MGTNNTKERRPKILQPENMYSGQAVKYKFLYTVVDASLNENDSYFPLLKRTCAMGYKLMKFFRLPHTKRNINDHKRPFQGIFCYHPELKRAFDLHVARTTLTSDSKAMDISALYRIIAQNTNTGGRLLSIEVKGRATPQKIARGDVDIELFFEVPNTPVPKEYVYQCVPVTINLENEYKHGVYESTRFNHDWNTTLNTFLTQGWKLVDIVLDIDPDLARSFSARSMWVFEKAYESYSVNRTLYESRIIEHDVTVVQDVTSNSVDHRLEKVLDNLGTAGWELASVIQTPTRRQAGWKSKIKVLVIFQRRMVQTGEIDKVPIYDVVRTSGFQTIPEDQVANDNDPYSNQNSYKSKYTEQLKVDTNENTINTKANGLHYVGIPSNNSRMFTGHNNRSPDSVSQISERRQYSPPSPDFKYPIFGQETVLYEAERNKSPRSYQSSVYSNSSQLERRGSSSGSAVKYPMFGPETVEYSTTRRNSVIVQAYRGPRRAASIYGSLQSLQSVGYGGNINGLSGQLLRLKPVRRSRPSTFSL